MDLALSEAQELLKHTVNEFVARESSRTRAFGIPGTDLGYSKDVWRQAADLGWLSMATPERYGGSESELLDIAVVFEGLGYGPVYGPYFSSGVLSPLVLQEAGSEEQKREFLPRLASGDIVATVAISEQDLSWGPPALQMQAVETTNGYRLSGSKLFVHDAHNADYLITAARTSEGTGPEGISLLLMPVDTPGVAVTKLTGFTSSEAEVRFDDVELPRSALLGEQGGGWPSLDRAMLRALPVLCAFIVGGQQGCFEMAVEYSRERQQFGRPIGRFQHVQDHIVQLVDHLDASRWTTWEAIWRIESGAPWPEISVHMAKAIASEGYVHAADYAHEVFAGNGTVAELGLTMYTRLSRSLYHQLGDPTYHKERLGDLLAARAAGLDVTSA